MKPMGRKPKSHNYPDRHCRFSGKRALNWWEGECESCNCATERQDAQREIRGEMENWFIEATKALDEFIENATDEELLAALEAAQPGITKEIEE